MKVLIYSNHNFARPFFEKANNNKHELIFTEKGLNKTTALLAEGCEAITLFTSDNASAEVLTSLGDLGVKYIALRSVGYDHVDIAKAQSLGIKVANVPAYSPYSIAEHAVTLLMALNRKIILSQHLMMQNDFRLDQLVGFDLHGKTVGIVGTGKTGAAFAHIMHGFGCTLLAYDIEQNKDLINHTKITYTSFEHLCLSSDVVSIHCPLNEATHYKFNKNAFDKMKKGAVLINTARGGIVNTKDLLEALDQGILAAAGLDVYENEKPIFFHNHSGTEIEDPVFEKLRAHPHVLLTGHQAFLTNEALTGIATTTITNLDAWEQSGTSENEITE